MAPILFPTPAALASLALSSWQSAPHTSPGANPAVRPGGGAVAAPNTLKLVLSCWDGIFAPSTLDAVLRGGEVRRHPFTAVFDRSSGSKGGGSSALESAICSVLDALDDGSRYVEYWFRDPPNGPRVLEVHRDVDEVLCRNERIPVELGSDAKVGRQRCPNHGHVLYVRAEGEGRRAPTFVLEEEGDQVGSGEVFHSPGAGPPRPVKVLWPVAAVTNRLLRFRGECLHAVSYPPDAFLVGGDDGPAEGKRRKDGIASGRRAVLLFNTWDVPPLHPAVGEPLSKDELDFMRRVDGMAASPKCRPLEEWCPTTIIPPSLCELEPESRRSDKTVVRFSAPLLGGSERRGCAEASIEACADAEKMGGGLQPQTQSSGGCVVQGVALRSV